MLYEIYYVTDHTSDATLCVCVDMLYAENVPSKTMVGRIVFFVCPMSYPFKYMCIWHIYAAIKPDFMVIIVWHHYTVWIKLPFSMCTVYGLCQRNVLFRIY